MSLLTGVPWVNHIPSEDEETKGQVVRSRGPRVIRERVASCSKRAAGAAVVAADFPDIYLD